MARRYKRFEEHSERWQRQARKEGVTPNRWNSWLKLSESTRKTTDPRKYGAGQSIAAQRIERKRAKAEASIAAKKRNSRKSVIRHNVARMTERDLDWTIDASVQQLSNRASMKVVPGYDSNPWWYR